MLEAAGAPLRLRASTGTTSTGAASATRKTGRMMPEDGLEQLRQHRRHLPGRRRLSRRARPRLAVGPADPDPPRLRAVREPAARAPASRASSRRSPTASRATSTMVVVRENNEGEYSRDRRPHASRAPSTSWPSRRPSSRGKGCDRVMRYAFELAATRPKQHVTSATKSNGIIHTHAVLGRALRRDGEGLSRTSRPTSTTSTS